MCQLCVQMAWLVQNCATKVTTPISTGWNLVYSCVRACQKYES